MADFKKPYEQTFVKGSCQQNGFKVNHYPNSKQSEGLNYSEWVNTLETEERNRIRYLTQLKELLLIV